MAAFAAWLQGLTLTTLTALFLGSQPEPKIGDLIEIFHPFYRHWAIYIGDGYVVHLAPPGKGIEGLPCAGAGRREMGELWVTGDPNYYPHRYRGTYYPCSLAGCCFLSAVKWQFDVGQWFSNSVPWNPRGSNTGAEVGF